jgi:tetratricopeptide (TPR) repeat protein
MAKHWGDRPSLNDSLIGDCWADLGDNALAEAAYRRSSDLHPEVPQGWMGICHLRLLEKSFDAARAMYQENRPKYLQFVFSTEIAAQVEFFARNFPEAERLYRELASADSDGGDTFWGAVNYQSAIGRSMQANGDEAPGGALLKQCIAEQTKKLSLAPADPVHLYILAAVESSLGRREQAFEYLTAARAAGWTDFRSLKLDPRFDSISADPRFNKLLTEMAAKVSELKEKALIHFINSPQP